MIKARIGIYNGITIRLLRVDIISFLKSLLQNLKSFLPFIKQLKSSNVDVS